MSNEPEKVIACFAAEVGEQIKPLLEGGWKVKMMCPESVSISTALNDNSGLVTRKTETIKGKIVFVLHQPEQK